MDSSARTPAAELLASAPAAAPVQSRPSIAGRLRGLRRAGKHLRLPLSGYVMATMIALAPLWGVRSAGSLQSPSIGALGELTLGRLFLCLLLAAFALDLIRVRSRPRHFPRVVIVFVVAAVLLEGWLYVNAATWGCLGCSGSFGGFTDLVAAALLLVAVLWTFPQCRPVALAAIAVGCVLGACLALAGVGEFGSNAGAHVGGRLSGPFGNPNYLAYAVTPALPILLAYAGIRSWAWRVAALLAAGVVCVALALTFSRGGLLAVAVGSVTVLVLQAKPGAARWRRAAVICVPLVVAGAVAYPLLHDVRVERDNRPRIRTAELARSLDHSGWDGTAEGGIAGEPAHMSNAARGTILVVRSSVPVSGVSHPLGTALPGSTYTLSFEAQGSRKAGTLRFGLEDNYAGNGPAWAQDSVGRRWRRYSVSWRPTARSANARLFVWEPHTPAAFALRNVRIAVRSTSSAPARTQQIGLRLLGSNFTAEQHKLRQITGTDEAYYVESRVRAARLAFSVFADQPIRGIGWERFTGISSRRLPFGALPTHDEYLRFLAELGLIGFGLLLAVGGAAVAALRHQPPSRLRTATIGALAAAAVSLLFINGLAVPAPAVWVLVVCCIAVTGAAARPKRSDA